MEMLRSGCGTTTMSRAEALKYALLVVGLTFGVCVLYVWVKRTVGPNIWIEALGGATASIAPLLYLLVLMREYSLRVRLTLTLGLFGAVYGIGLLASWI